MNVTPVVSHEVNQLCELWKGCIINCINGNHKNFSTFHKLYASYAVQHKNHLQSIKFPKIVFHNAPIRLYFNFLKIRFLELFRIKTKDEKALKLILKEFQKTKVQ